MRTIALCVAALAVVGCGKSTSYAPKPTTKVKEASVQAGKETELFPLSVGNQWVYTVDTQQGSFELTLKVTDVRQEGGATIATITSDSQGRNAIVSEWRVDSTGIYQISDGPNRTFDPPQLLVPFPLDKEKTNKQTVNGPLPIGGQTGSMETTTRFAGMQQIDTDMERLSAAAVESLTTWQSPDGPAASRGMTWWAPGIGFVRQRQEVGIGQGRAVIVMKLKSYSFK